MKDPLIKYTLELNLASELLIYEICLISYDGTQRHTIKHNLNCDSAWHVFVFTFSC